MRDSQKPWPLSFLLAGLIVSLMVVFFSVSAATGALVAYYNFDGQTLDLSGNGNDGTLINGAGYVGESPFGFGQSLALRNGGGTENQGMNVPGAASLGGNPFTLAYWMNPAGGQGNAGLERLTSRAGDSFETAIGDANAVGGTTSPTNVTLSYYQGTWNVTNVEIIPDAWTHVAWVNSGPGPNDMELYLNGASVYTGIGVDAGRPGAGFMNVGTRHNEVEGFEGYIDDLRLYDTALSGAEILQILRSRAEFLVAGGRLGILGRFLWTQLRRRTQTTARRISSPAALNHVSCIRGKPDTESAGTR